MKQLFFLMLSLVTGTAVFCQDAEALLQQVRTKLDKVNDYEATGKLTTNVTFIKAPVATVRIYYKKPEKMKIINESGISFIPKGAVNINLVKFLAQSGSYELIDAGKDPASGFRVLKLLPVDEQAEIVLSTLYIDEQQLVRKAKNTTRDNGTYELEMTYGRYAAFGLPDKVIFTFNTKDYKLPKGVTFDYDSGSKKQPADPLKNKKGKVEISYSSYSINRGVADKIFMQE